MLRLHPNVKEYSKQITIFTEQIIDVSLYPDMQELSLMSDCIISDYSSASMDFAILKKPAFLYCPDIEEYKKSRGLLPEFYKFPFTMAILFSELIDNIQTYNEKDYLNGIAEYFQQNPIYDVGDASKKATDWILEKMKR